jgi:hypothetical protein
LKILFPQNDNNSFNLLFNEESQIAKSIYKIVEILFLLFKIQKKEREKIYNSNITDIKGKDFNILIYEINMLQVCDIEINEKLIGLFNIISDFIDQKKANISLVEYIDLILLTLPLSYGLESISQLI